MLEGEVNGPQYGSMREERQMATGQSPLKDVIGLQRVATKNVIGLQRATKDVIGLHRATKDAIGLQRATKDVIGLQRVVEYQSVIRSIVPEGLRVKLPSTSACWQETELYVINNDSNLSMIHRKIKQLKVTRMVRVPQQWNCWASYIATGMKQLQDVQLRQMEKKPDLPEVVKRGISSLPTLSSPGQDTSPVDIQDWLEEVGSVMTDLSDSSWDWWLQTKELAEDHYRKWIKSTPMEKISLAMPKNPSLEQGRYGRVNARAAGMVLAALPQEVKSEMITKKISGSTAILIFKLLTAYRPGREKEKTLFLQQLTSPEAAAAAEEAVQGLRRCGRWHARAKDLTVTVPDPVLMIKGLAAIVSGVLGRHQDVWLRTSMVRQKLQLDSNPTEETTLGYHKHLQAEMELLSTASTSTTGNRTAPRIKSATTTAEQSPVAPSSTTAPAAKPKASPAKDKLCKWFAKTESGCRRGVDCQFGHEWGATPKAGRCLICSSTGHVKRDCPVKEKGAGTKFQKPRPDQPQSTSSTTAPATRAMAAATPEVTTAPLSPSSQPAAEPSPSTSPPSSQARVPPEEERPGELKQMLADASKMLKTMMANNPSTSSGSSTVPSYESIQKQLDELRLKAMVVADTTSSTTSSTRLVCRDSEAT